MQGDLILGLPLLPIGVLFDLFGVPLDPKASATRAARRAGRGSRPTQLPHTVRRSERPPVSALALRRFHRAAS